MEDFNGWGGGAFGLRRELCARNLRWAAEGGFLHERTLGRDPAVLYRADEQGRHGNFHPASYRRILADAGWKRRLEKAHTTARRHLLSHDAERSELDSCNSSDALLMNVFCHPGAAGKNSALRKYLGIDPEVRFCFGYKPRVPMTSGKIDCTEVDMQAGDLSIEAKLTEADFQSSRWELVERYRDFDEVFDRELLPGNAERMLGYQLVRGILAAFSDTEEIGRYCLVCDARRPDLIEQWYRVLAAMRCPDLRWRCVLVTWQELSRALPSPLRVWLQRKYGIFGEMPGASSGRADEGLGREYSGVWRGAIVVDSKSPTDAERWPSG